jgi:hypothetical protein
MSTWASPNIVDDPRILHNNRYVRAMAEYLHNMESLHMHQDTHQLVCVYCALRASNALRAYDRATHDPRMGPPEDLPAPQPEGDAQVTPKTLISLTDVMAELSQLKEGLNRRALGCASLRDDRSVGHERRLRLDAKESAYDHAREMVEELMERLSHALRVPAAVAIRQGDPPT